MRTTALFCIGLGLAALAVGAEAATSTGGAEGGPGVQAPGSAFEPPVVSVAPDGPRIFECTREAGPDETVLLVGEGLAGELSAWGPSPEGAAQPITPAVQFNTGQLLAATIPQKHYDGIFVLRVQGEKGFSRDVVLNAPEAWWLMPDKVAAVSEVMVYGRNLARRPDFDRSYLYLRRDGEPTGRLLEATRCDKYRVGVRLPEGLTAGQYTLWVHTGQGGQYGWSNALQFTLAQAPGAAQEFAVERPDAEGLRRAVAQAVQAGGGRVRLPERIIELSGTLKLPAGVVLQGAGRDKTILRFSGPTKAFEFAPPSGWNWAVGGVHGPNDQITWEFEVPGSGQWSCWLRYACDLSWLQRPGLAETFLIVDDGEPIALDELPNTMGFDWFAWRKLAELKLSPGRHRLTWRNNAKRGGGINLDAVLLAAEADYRPSNVAPYPVAGPKVLIAQGEQFVAVRAENIRVPGRQHVAVWLAGDGAGLADLAVQGSAATDTGVLIRHEQFPQWARECRVERVGVTGVEGHGTDNRTVHFVYAHGAVVRGCELWGQAPIFMSGVRQCSIADNRLVTQTRAGGGAEGAIVGRTNILEQCVIENNLIANPPGREAGTATTRRLIWVSTGHGSVSHNYLARNGADRPRFGGLPGTDQNVGEMILLEACQRVAYQGPCESAVGDTITLPAAIAPTPEAQLGTVARFVLPTDAQGRETPYWPPAEGEDDGVFEPTMGQYFVTVLRGSGMGQTRRAVARRGRTIQLDRPWNVAPREGDRVLVCTAFYRNLIVANDVCEGMSGVQLWFSCIENVISGNVIRHQRGGGLAMVGAVSTMASSMPTMWNRGVAPCNFNTFEGNLTEDTTGAGFSGGGDTKLEIDFPIALGNVVRHNSMLDNRGSGITLGGSRRRDPATQPAQTLGTIIEQNIVRDVHNAAYRINDDADGVVIRRNLAHFWHFGGEANEPLSGVLFSGPGVYATDHNISESRAGQRGPKMVDERHVYQEGKPETLKKEEPARKVEPEKPSSTAPSQPAAAGSKP